MLIKVLLKYKKSVFKNHSPMVKTEKTQLPGKWKRLSKQLTTNNSFRVKTKKSLLEVFFLTNTCWDRGKFIIVICHFLSFKLNHLKTEVEVVPILPHWKHELLIILLLWLTDSLTASSGVICVIERVWPVIWQLPVQRNMNSKANKLDAFQHWPKIIDVFHCGALQSHSKYPSCLGQISDSSD